MSGNYKNTNNYSALLNEIKSTTLNDKIKGRNHKINLKRNQSQIVDKPENFPTKTVMNSTTNTEINQKYASMDLRSIDKKKILNGINPLINEYDKKPIETIEKRNQSISNLSQNSSNVGNKIDINISVNYNKPNITNSVNYANSNSSSGLSSTKSFFHTPGSLNNMNVFNSVNPYIKSHNQTTYISSNDADLIKNKINSKKPENNFNTSSISEEKIKEKFFEHTSQFGNNSLAASAFGLNHLRNRSQNLLDQNNLNISLMNCENKNLKNFLINQSHMNMSINNFNNINNFSNTSNINNFKNAKVLNNDNNKKLVFSHYKYPSVDKSTNQPFAMNNKLLNYLNNSPDVQKRSDYINQSFKINETTVNLNTTGENLNPNVKLTETNMKDFTLNKNNDELTQIVDLTEKQQDMDSSMSGYKFLILETNLEDQLSNLKSDKENDKELKDTEKGKVHQNPLALSLLNKKFLIYKKTSEECIKVIQGEKNRNLIQKLFQGYNEIIHNLITHHSEKTAENENISINYKIVSKKYSELYKAYKEKSDEIKVLKSKLNQVNSSTKSKIDKEKSTHSIIDLSLNISNSNIKNTEVGRNNNNKNLNTTTTNFENYTENVYETQADVNRSRLIKMMNKNVLDDLDAIYFFDKINMRANSASHKKIPKLDFNFLEKDKEKEKENLQNLQIQKKIKEDKVLDGKDNALIQNNQMDKLKHNKKTSLLKLEDLIILPDKEKLIPANSVMNANKQQSLKISNQNVTNKYSNYFSNNSIKSNSLHAKKLSSQDLKITNKQMGGWMK